MNIEKYIKDEALRLNNSQRRVEIAPEIDERHFEIIKRKYNGMIADNFKKYVLVMSYTKLGMFFMTGDTFYFDNFMQGGLKKVNFKDILKVEIESGKTFSSDKIYLKTKSTEYILDGCIDGLNLSVLQSVFSYIISKSKTENEDFSISEQGKKLSELPEKLKLLYLQVLCNYAYINDEIIDAAEATSI